MVRLAILLVLLCLTFWEWRGGERKPVYWLALIGLYIFFTLRYGQGTDYLTYMSIYANVPPLQTLPWFGAYQYNRIEFGFFYLISFFRMLGVHYVLFVAIITAFAFFCINRFINRFSPLPIFALTFFFAVYSLTYVESALRQMLSISIALGWVFIDWADGKRIRAIIGILIASTFHTSALVLLVLPILFWNPRPLYIIEWKLKTTGIVIGALLLVTAVINFVDLTPIFSRLPTYLSFTILSYYDFAASPSLMALANRALFMAIVFFLTWRQKDDMAPREKLLFNLYCVGFALYIVLMSSDELASRVNIYFRIIDFCLIPLLMYKNRDLVKKAVVGMPVMLMLLSFLYVKDITAIMGFAQYYNSNPLQYPYITVFNTDAVFDQKFVNVKNANAMNAYQAGGQSWDDYYQSLLRKPNVRSPIVPY